MCPNLGVRAVSYGLIPPRDRRPPWVGLLCSLLATAMPRTHEVRLGPQAQQPAHPALWVLLTSWLENSPELRVGLKPGDLSNKEVPTFKYQPMKCAGTKPSSLSCGADAGLELGPPVRAGRGPCQHQRAPSHVSRSAPGPPPHPVCRMTQVPETPTTGAAPKSLSNNPPASCPGRGTGLPEEPP